MEIFLQQTKLNSDAEFTVGKPFYLPQCSPGSVFSITSNAPTGSWGFGFSKHLPQEWDQKGLIHITCSPGMPRKSSRAWLESVVKTHVKIHKGLHMKAIYIENRESPPVRFLTMTNLRLFVFLQESFDTLNSELKTLPWNFVRIVSIMPHTSSIYCEQVMLQRRPLAEGQELTSSYPCCIVKEVLWSGTCPWNSVETWSNWTPSLMKHSGIICKTALYIFCTKPRIFSCLGLFLFGDN